MFAAALFAAAALASAGCGSNADEGDGAAATTSGGEAQAIEISATDFAFDPSSVSVDGIGSVTFRLVNDGQAPHALEIDGQGIEQESDQIGPGETAELTVDLSQGGEYELYCPVGNHREQGMEGTLTVGGSAGADGTTTGDDGGTTTDDSEDDDGAYDY